VPSRREPTPTAWSSASCGRVNPIENAYVESFNGKFRDECLNEHWFISLADAKAVIEAWRVDLQHRLPTRLARTANAGGLRRSRLRGLQARVWGLLGGCSGTTDQGPKPEGLSLPA
jgi:hypothetical protein